MTGQDEQLAMVDGPTVAVPPPLGPRDVTPLSVLQTAQGGWQGRRRQWLQAGLDGGDGRGHITTWPTIVDGGRVRWQRTVSIFDPVLTEVLYGWYCPPGGRVLDPFAGGATRGLVAAARGYHYLGVDVSAQQVAANRDTYGQWRRRGLVTGSAEWVCGAAQHVLPTLDGGFDYVLTCPPYHNLEVYSDDPADLSTMGWMGFMSTLDSIVRAAAALLAPDRFATWVVGDLRDPGGLLRRLPSRVADLHDAAGMPLAVDQVVVAPLGGKFGVIWRWWRTRTACRIHSHALTFVSGDRRRAARAVTDG